MCIYFFYNLSYEFYLLFSKCFLKKLSFEYSLQDFLEFLINGSLLRRNRNYNTHNVC